MLPSSFTRRSVLRLGSSGLLGAVAGCSASGEGNTTTSTTVQASHPGQESATLTENPSLSDNSRFHDRPCPTFGNPKRTVCYHTVARDPAVYLRPESENVGQPTAGCVPSHVFTLVNRTETPVWTSTASWRVMRKSDDGWNQTLPTDDTGRCVECLERLPPIGGYFEWALAIEQEHPCPRDPNLVCVGPLTSDPGLHAFVVDAYENVPENASAAPIRCVALFELVEESIECI